MTSLEQYKHMRPIQYNLTHDATLHALNGYMNDLNNWDYERKDPPYIFELGAENKIHYFGTAHVSKINDPIVETLRKDLELFISQHPNTVVLVEDWELVDFKDEEEACDKKGERGLAMFWSHKLGASVVPVDYDHTTCEHLRIIGKGARYEDLVLFTLLYYVKARGYYKWKEQSDLGAYLVERVNKQLNSAGFDIIDLETLERFHKDKFGQTIEERSELSGWKDLNVKEPSNGVNDLFKEYILLRERNFLFQIYAHYAEGKNVYSLFGCDHAQFGEPILRQLVESNVR